MLYAESTNSNSNTYIQIHTKIVRFVRLLAECVSVNVIKFVFMSLFLYTHTRRQERERERCFNMYCTYPNKFNRRIFQRLRVSMHLYEDVERSYAEIGVHCTHVYFLCCPAQSCTSFWIVTYARLYVFWKVNELFTQTVCKGTFAKCA